MTNDIAWNLAKLKMVQQSYLLWSLIIISSCEDSRVLTVTSKKHHRLKMMNIFFSSIKPFSFKDICYLPSLTTDTDISLLYHHLLSTR